MRHNYTLTAFFDPRRIRALVIPALFFLVLCILASCSPGQEDALPEEAGAPNAAPTPSVLILGGGSSHDYDRWFNQEDRATLDGAGFETSYTHSPGDLDSALASVDVLILTNNQPIPDSTTRQAIFDFAEEGNGLLLIHPAVWYNWEDWPAYNRQLVGGGSRSHEPYRSFEVTITNPDHPITQEVPSTFVLEDELYRFEPDSTHLTLNVLAVGEHPEVGEKYPVVWAAEHPTYRIAGITLGHDGYAHELQAYKTLLINSVRWLAE